MRLFFSLLAVREFSQASTDHRIRLWSEASPDERELARSFLTSLTVEMHSISARATAICQRADEAISVLPAVAHRISELPIADQTALKSLKEAHRNVRTASDLIHKSPLLTAAILAQEADPNKGGSSYEALAQDMIDLGKDILSTKDFIDSLEMDIEKMISSLGEVN